MKIKFIALVTFGFISFIGASESESTQNKIIKFIKKNDIVTHVLCGAISGGIDGAIYKGNRFYIPVSLAAVSCFALMRIAESSLGVFSHNKPLSTTENSLTSYIVAYTLGCFVSAKYFPIKYYTGLPLKK